MVGKETMSALNNDASVAIRQGGHSTVQGSPSQLVGELAISLVDGKGSEARLHRKVGDVFSYITGEEVQLVGFGGLLQQG